MVGPAGEGRPLPRFAGQGWDGRFWTSAETRAALPALQFSSDGEVRFGEMAPGCVKRFQGRPCPGATGTRYFPRSVAVSESPRKTRKVFLLRPLSESPLFLLISVLRPKSVSGHRAFRLREIPRRFSFSPAFTNDDMFLFFLQTGWKHSGIIECAGGAALSVRPPKRAER